jgi:hypothetical protein
MGTDQSGEELATQQDFVDKIDELSPERDLLLVMLLVTNLPIINAQFGMAQGEEVLAEVASESHALGISRWPRGFHPCFSGSSLKMNPTQRDS